MYVNEALQAISNPQRGTLRNYFEAAETLAAEIQRRRTTVADALRLAAPLDTPSFDDGEGAWSDYHEATEVLAAEVLRLRERIAELEQRVEWERNCAQSAEVGNQHVLASAQEHIATLEAALRTYGRHTEQCRFRLGGTCNCGFRAAIAALEGK